MILRLRGQIRSTNGQQTKRQPIVTTADSNRDRKAEAVRNAKKAGAALSAAYPFLMEQAAAIEPEAQGV